MLGGEVGQLPFINLDFIHAFQWVLDYCVKKFVHEIKNVVVWLAEGRISKELLLKIITSLIMDDEYPEELKLEILEAANL